VAASLVLRLDSGQTRSALGLAYMQAAGGKEAGVGAGGTARAIYPAFAAMGGVQAALLARSGIEGPPTALDGDAGFFRLYFGRPLDAEQTARLLDPQGSAWAESQFKPWPCCRHSHPYIFAAQALRPGLDPRGVSRIIARVNRSAAKLCMPIDERRRPRTLQDAKYSIPFMIAFALVHDEISLQTLDASALEDARVLAMAERVFVEETGQDEPGLPHASITVHGTASVESRTFDAPFHAPQTKQVLEAKFRSCLAYAGWSASDAGGLWHRASGLDDSDLPAIRNLLGFGKATFVRADPGTAHAQGDTLRSCS
jgi:2-methylcitrate dehydratase PrpD